MATETTPTTETPKSWEDFLTELIKNPLASLGGGLLGGYILGTHVTGAKMEKMQDQHALQMEKRDDQFTKLIEQMSLTNRRQ